MAMRTAAAAPLVDAVLTSAALAGTVAQLSHGGVLPTGDAGLTVPGAVLAAAAAVPLMFWRRSAVAAFVACGAGAVLLAAFGYPVDLAIGPAMALFLLAGGRGQTWTPRRAATVAATFAAYLLAVAVGRNTLPAAALLHTGLVWAVAWFAGDRLRTRAERAERDAAQERRLAIAEERARIARDLHDSAAHAVSVIALRAGTARMGFDQDPERARTALRDVEELARRVVAEMDDIVGALRGGPARGEVEPPPGLAALDALVAQHAAAGMRVTVREAGEPRQLSSAADQAAYRILQESLTNAARHGAGEVEVVLRYADDALNLLVTNPGRSVGAGRPGGGHGLIGMRERAGLVGGTLRADGTGGVFRVDAWIPTGGGR